MKFGCQNMVSPLRRVIVKTPEAAFRSQSFIDSEWRRLNFLSPPDFDRAVGQHREFVTVLERAGTEILLLGADDRTTLDSIYTHDPAIVTDYGAILFQTGKEQRRGEAPAMKDALDKWGIETLGVVDGEATAEGGDLVWLDQETLLAGRGFRTNAAGVAALQSLLKPFGIRVIGFDLPYWQGPGDVLHLMSYVSLLDSDLAVVHKPLMPVALYELLQRRGTTMIDVAPEEYDTLGCNVLALAPRHVLLMEGNPVTRKRLEHAGCRIEEFAGSEIAWKGSGGPTCLTRPVLRF